MTAGCSVGSADGLAAVVSGCVGWDGALLDEEDVVLVNVAVATEDDFVPFPALSVQAESGSTVSSKARAMP
ncbi:hypothetical protein L3H50_04625 [Corynebacterium sp. MC-04]|uniref:Uncharacterized protein n=1 Tax=Corynebacterium parakroppenstedtii TaxID=2828363 RepID=A0ABS9HJ81_9CORY|nr:MULTISPECIES: hypothetical protein [Corynebacterium]KXB50330.1 hypothetical protein HMPREF1861_01110 [Corynebacterium kroppenstedtii]MBY0788986.1 hypothetical protein [Corynebacterium parakroppenstedtii]MBY0793049.1 hypothetical protein [Corynebacterium parakroppenstedtii]MBY0795647.1 hypothetical protein [Corynebacterium parakroppenstedtii]MBY0797709.1 hypothetical protein [Corynebacterium parakroppenstedtii]